MMIKFFAYTWICGNVLDDAWAVMVFDLIACNIEQHVLLFSRCFYTKVTGSICYTPSRVTSYPNEPLVTTKWARPHHSIFTHRPHLEACCISQYIVLSITQLFSPFLISSTLGPCSRKGEDPDGWDRILCQINLATEEKLGAWCNPLFEKRLVCNPPEKLIRFSYLYISIFPHRRLFSFFRLPPFW